MQPYLFPELGDEEERRREENRQSDLSSLPHYDRPENDNQRLLNLQRRFLVSNDQRAWEEMWRRCLVIAGKLITIEKKQKGLHFSDEDMYDKEMDAVSYVLRRYRKKRDDGHIWHVKKSFMNAIRGGVLHALYYEAQDKPKHIKVLYVGDLFDVLSLKS